MSTPIDPQRSRQVGPKQPSHQFSFTKPSDPLLKNINKACMFPLRNTANLSRMGKYPNTHRAVKGKRGPADKVFKKIY